MRPWWASPFSRSPSGCCTGSCGTTATTRSSTQFRSLPASVSGWPRSLSAASYLLLTGYDTLGLRYARHALPYRRTALASFVGYAFCNTVGYSLVSGGSVRLRLYSGWGLSTLAITKVIAFCSVTFWLGFMAVGGVVFVAEPLAVPALAPPPVRERAAVRGGFFSWRWLR